MSENLPAIAQPEEQLPAWLQTNSKPMGLELVSQYVVPPRLKIVQTQSKPELLTQYSPGTVLAMPSKTLLVDVAPNEHGKPGEESFPFIFVPIFFYPEFCCWNPYNLAGQLPTIRERSLDAKSKIANLCRQRVEIPCPEDNTGKEVCKYKQHLNYIVMIMNHELFGVPCLMSFHSGEYGTGQSFCTTTRLRRADLFGCQYQAHTIPRHNDKNQHWRGFSIQNPPTKSGASPWVDSQEMYDLLKNEHESYAQSYASGLLQANYDDEQEGNQSTVIDSAAVAAEV